MGKADELLETMRQRRSLNGSVGGYRSSNSNNSSSLDTTPLSSREALDELQSQIDEMRPIRRKWESAISKNALDNKSTFSSDTTTTTTTTSQDHRYGHRLSSSHSPGRSSSWMSETDKTATSMDGAFLELPSKSSSSSSSSCIAVGELEMLDRKLARMRETFAKLESETADLNLETGELKEQVSQGLWRGKRGILGDPSKRKPLLTTTQKQNIEDDDDPELSLALSSSSEGEDESLPSMRSEMVPRYNVSSAYPRPTSSMASVGPGRPPVPLRNPSPLNSHVSAIFEMNRR